MRWCGWPNPSACGTPPVEGYGNFGSIDGDPPAAFRYTECRLMPIAQELLNELRQQTVDFRPDYASTTEEPVVLPAQFSNLLVNGASGIAVGMATNDPAAQPAGGLQGVLMPSLRTATSLWKSSRGTSPRPDFPDRGRDSQHAGRDPPGLRNRSGDDQASRHLWSSTRRRRTSC